MATVQVSAGRTRGFSRLVLLIIAVSIGLSGLVLASINKTGATPANLTLIMALFIGSAVFAEVVVRFTAPYADPVILPIAVTLTGLGLAIVEAAIQQHRGWVKADDSPLGGLRLTLWLPLYKRT